MLGELLVARSAPHHDGVERVARRLAAAAGWPVHVHTHDATAPNAAVELSHFAAERTARLLVVPLDAGPDVVSGILRRSRIPTLWLPNEEMLPVGVTVALDGSGWSRFVLDEALRLRHLVGGELRARTVIRLPDDAREATVRRILADTVADAIPLDVEVHHDVVGALVAAGTAMAPAVLAIGVHRGGTANGVPGHRTGHDVVARATSAVLAVPL